MALLTADKLYDNVRFPSLQKYTLKNSTNFFYGSMGAVNNANSGRLEPFAGVSGQIPLGRIYDADNGAQDTTNAALGVGNDALTIYTGISGRPEGRCAIDSEVIPNISVTGLSSAAQIGAPVFLNNDDQTWTLTAPATNALAIGEILDFVSGSSGDVLIWSYALRSILMRSAGASGGGGVWFHIATAPGAATGALGVAASAFGLLIPAPFHGKIVDAFAMNNGVALTGGPVTVTPSIVPNGGSNTPVTSTGMILTAALAAKSRIACGAISAANEFHIGDTLDLTTSTVTSITAGTVDFFVKLQPVVGC